MYRERADDAGSSVYIYLHRWLTVQFQLNKSLRDHLSTLAATRCPQPHRFTSRTHAHSQIIKRGHSCNQHPQRRASEWSPWTQISSDHKLVSFFIPMPPLSVHRALKRNKLPQGKSISATYRAQAQWGYYCTTESLKVSLYRAGNELTCKGLLLQSTLFSQGQRSIKTKCLDPKKSGHLGLKVLTMGNNSVSTLEEIDCLLVLGLVSPWRVIDSSLARWWY